jgi:hypothetical protein
MRERYDAKPRFSIAWAVVCVLPVVAIPCLLWAACSALETMRDSASATSYQQLMHHWSMIGLTATAAVMAFVHMLFFYVCRRSDSLFKRANRPVQRLLLAVWVLGPPIYFLFEWGKLYHGPYAGDAYEMYKTGQDLATKLWAAILVILGGLYKDW